LIYDYPFTPYYLEISGGRLHYLDEGEGQAVVLVHGNPTWSYYYRGLIQRLARNFRVIALDHLGCGLSDKPQDYDYTLKNHIANLISLLNHLGLKQISLVIHDWGGPIGIGMAASSDIVIQRLVVLNTAAFRSQRIPLRIRLCRWPVFGKILVRGFNGFAWPATYMAVKKRLEPKVKQAYLLPYDNWKNRVAVHEFVLDIPLSPRHRSYQDLVDVENYLTVIKEEDIPLTVIWGGRDFCFDDHFYREWQQRFPHALFHYLENGGHYVLEDMKEEAEDLIEAFLKDVASSPDNRQDE
jgi:haloalkane dehalogenase